MRMFKPGQLVKVVRTSSYSDRLRVERETDTMVVFTNGERFNKQTLRMVGGSKWTFPYLSI